MKFLASDLDGTILLKEEPEATARNIEAIKKFREAGNTFTLISGRQYRTFKQFLDDNNIECDFISGEDGAIIFDKDMKEFYRKNFDDNVLKELLDLCDKYQVKPTLDDGYDYFEKDNGNILKAFIRKQEVFSKKDFFEEVKNIKGITIYFSENWLNIISDFVDKVHAVDYITSKDEFLYHEVHTVGNEVNDEGMITKYDGVLLGAGKYNYFYEYVEDLINE